jgi:hypothetical protein
MTVERRVDQDLDTLYGVRPEEFTALRKELAAAARKRGDTDAAKAIAAARRPTVAAWVVNGLVRADPTAQARMTELSDALRAAHAEMNGARIRELTGAQRKLVHHLVDAAFETAGVAVVTAALRDDVTATLQAAIADPEVAARLGRLAKAEKWSGFGEFGASTAVAASTPRAAPASSRTRAPELGAARRKRDAAAAEVDVARAAHGDARQTVADRQTDVATARRHYEELLEKLNAAEQQVQAADTALDAANRAERETSARVEAATTELDSAQAALAALEK